jgi:16S rRNA (cytosine1402-N4)-methyltransferase
MEDQVSHTPVLLEETLSALSCRNNVASVYLDCTVGLGGHAEAILKVTEPYGRVIGIDRDRNALAIAKKRLAPFQDRITLYHGCLKELLEIAKKLNLSEVSGILFDLGISSMHLDSAERGFSFQNIGPLDMRMDQALPKTAADMVNTLREKELADIIYRYGEERGSRKIAAFIVRHREEKGEITQTTELADIVCHAVRQKSKWTKMHPATKTFQALRIAVNDEIGQLEAGLSHAVSLLAVGGRLVVISFHSLEDRPVKNTFKALAHSKKFITLYKKPIVPSQAEMTNNIRARSAKLRALERVA